VPVIAAPQLGPKRWRDLTQGLAVAVLLFACGASVTDQGAEQDGEPLSVPNRAMFPHVENAMQMRCGTLDCHGQTGRNMRLYGLRGLRLDPHDNPLDGTTTTAEYDASYWSVVGLEPETLSSVVKQGGAHPETLTMIRKPRGIEMHKGGQLMTEGDPMDRCLVGWLAGRYDAMCDTVTKTPRPEAQ
jgi:hypothetical protein